MPRTIDEGFRVFHASLTPSDYETSAAESHRESIKTRLENEFGMKRFWRIGSFGNGTSITGYSDVDYMASIPTKKLSSNSSTSLSKVRESLAARFPNTGVRVSCPAVVVPFGTEAKETTEVTVADYLCTENGFKVYDISDCSGGWIEASPDAHNAYVRQVNDGLSYKVKPLIRFIKAWKYFNSVPISSFYLEIQVAKYASAKKSILYSIDVMCVFALLDSLGLASVRDPMGISGYIKACKSDADKKVALSKVSTALTRAKKAMEAEGAGRISEAFEWWDKLYAQEFPSYYR
jgi:hypothetical protein